MIMISYDTVGLTDDCKKFHYILMLCLLVKLTFKEAHKFVG